MILNEQNFSNTIGGDKLVVVDFWAEWCGPCKTLSPIIEQLQKENENVIIGKVDVEANRTLARKYGIRSIPTIMFFKEGKLQHKIVGLTSKKTLNETIQKFNGENQLNG